MNMPWSGSPTHPALPWVGALVVALVVAVWLRWEGRAPPPDDAAEPAAVVACDPMATSDDVSGGLDGGHIGYVVGPPSTDHALGSAVAVAYDPRWLIQRYVDDEGRQRFRLQPAFPPRTDRGGACCYGFYTYPTESSALVVSGVPDPCIGYEGGDVYELFWNGERDAPGYFFYYVGPNAGWSGNVNVWVPGLDEALRVSDESDSWRRAIHADGVEFHSEYPFSDDTLMPLVAPRTEHPPAATYDYREPRVYLPPHTDPVWAGLKPSSADRNREPWRKVDPAMFGGWDQTLYAYDEWEDSYGREYSAARPASARYVRFCAPYDVSWWGRSYEWLHGVTCQRLSPECE